MRHQTVEVVVHLVLTLKHFILSEIIPFYLVNLADSDGGEQNIASVSHRHLGLIDKIRNNTFKMSFFTCKLVFFARNFLTVLEDS